jgi:hypothetical protein
MSADDSVPLAGTVLVREAKQYGAYVLLPANALARALCEFKGCKTFTPTMVRDVKAMGFTVHTAPDQHKKL